MRDKSQIVRNVFMVGFTSAISEKTGSLKNIQKEVHMGMTNTTTVLVFIDTQEKT
jgi:hypothetical protein